MDLFVYGTLRSHALMAAVAGPGPLRSIAATLPDYVVFAVAGDVVPGIAPASGQTAHGVVWQDLTDTQMARLDTYEGAFGYVRGPVFIQTEVGLRTAEAYLPPTKVTTDAGSWSLTEWEAGHLTPAVLAAGELFSHDPLPDHKQVRAMWPMIEARAWSRFRAAAAPAMRRFDPAADDFTIDQTHPPMGRFFRFERVGVSHKTFTQHRSDTLTREVFFGIDAAMVLPYDPVRDRVLMVEQARIGPRMRHDPNPWMLEPIAGIVDARETPEQAALREAQEEAGLREVTLEPAGQFYVSPGATTDYFYTFIGLCDLPQEQPYLGGLPEESEDLRLHPMTFDDALALADTGEIQTGPAVYLLHWLLRHRSRLRATVS